MNISEQVYQKQIWNVLGQSIAMLLPNLMEDLLGRRLGPIKAMVLNLSNATALNYIVVTLPIIK